MAGSLSKIDFSRLKAERQLAKLVEPHTKARKFFNLVRENRELRALWELSNYMALSKLKFSDHGPIHGFVTARNAIIMLNILKEKGVETDLLKDKRADFDDVVVVLLGAGLFHDVGNAVHREEHWLTGPILLEDALQEELEKIYDREKAMLMRVMMFSCIYSHESIKQKLTVEASLIGLADYTDMTRGRAVGVFEQGKVNIHTVSSEAIERVLIVPGEKKPIRIMVELNNSSGIFHVEEFLMKNLMSGVLKNQVEVIAQVAPMSRKTEKRIIQCINLMEQWDLEKKFGV